MGPQHSRGQASDSRRAALELAVPIALVTLLGAILRVIQMGDTLVGDEMWTYVEATKPDLGAMLDYVRSDEEITPPLMATLAWFSAHLGDATVFVRLPAIAAGIATIPLTWAIALRVFGRRAALVAALLAALSPFLAFFSVEARAYGLAFAFAAASTLLLLVAIERRSWGWWVGYGLASCAAMYSHYTTAYVLAAQLAWVLWFHRELWKPALGANLLAAVLYLPWIPGFLDDLGSPTQDAFDSLSAFTLDTVIRTIPASPIGHPFAGLETFWGLGLELLLLAGIGVGIAGLISRLRGGLGRGEDPLAGSQRDLVVLVALLALASPVAIVTLGLLGKNQLLPRNLGVSIPYFYIGLAAVLTAGPRVYRLVGTAIVIVVFAIGAVRATGGRWQRTDVVAAAHLVDRELGPDDVVFDLVAPIVQPGQPPRQTLDVQLDEPHRVVEATSIEEIDEAIESNAGGRIAVVGIPEFVEVFEQVPSVARLEPVLDETIDGLFPTQVVIYEVPPGP